MSFEEAEILKERAEAFLRNAKRLIEEKEWDLAMFNLEQYSQLILKYKLLVKYGTYPRTHSIRRLLIELGKDNKEILKLLEDEVSLLYITKLEDAYIASRYLPRRYDEREVKLTYKFIIEVFKNVVEKI